MTGSFVDGGLIFNKKIDIQYSVSSTLDQYYSYYMFDNNPETWFCSQSIPNSSFQINIIDAGVKLNKYSVRVGDWRWTYPRSWRVTGFNGISWNTLSTVTESQMNQANNKVRSFPFTKIKNNYYTSLRFEMTDICYDDDVHQYSFCLADIEIFGDVVNIHGAPFCKTNNYIFNYIPSSFLYLYILK